MDSEKMLNNWLIKMREYYDLEDLKALTVEELNTKLIEMNFSLELTPEWFNFYHKAFNDFYSSAFEKEAFTVWIYNEELRRLFIEQDVVGEMAS